MTLFLTGQCADTFAPLYLAEDSTFQVIAVVEWDPNIGCYVLTIEGSSSAPTACQVIDWRGYGGSATPAGTYTRLCGDAGGCPANAAVPTLTLV